MGEVERVRFKNNLFPGAKGEWVRATDYEAERERREAAARERDQLRRERDAYWKDDAVETARCQEVEDQLEAAEAQLAAVREERDDAWAALERLQLGPDTLTPDGLKIVLEALRPKIKHDLAQHSEREGGE